MALSNRKRKKLDQARVVLRRAVAGGRDDWAAILEQLQLDGIAPAKSTFYQWVREERAAEASDDSGTWSLATDKTERPDIVLALLAWLAVESKWRRTSVTVDEATWAVRLCAALPHDVEATLLAGRRMDGKAPPPARSIFSFWQWVRAYAHKTPGLDHELAAIYYLSPGLGEDLVADALDLDSDKEE